jgi:hypothetical protein
MSPRRRDLFLQRRVLIRENGRMKEFRFKLIAEKDVESGLSDSQTFKIEQTTPIKDPVRLGFDLHNISEIVTLVSAVIGAAKAAKELADLFRKAKAKKVVVQSPFRTVEFQEGEDSEEKLLEFFRGAGLS